MIRTFVLIGLCVTVSHTLARQTYPILLTAIQDDFDLTTGRAGALVTATFLAYMVGVGAMTYLSGRTEPKRTLVAGLLLASVGFATVAVSGGFWTLAIGIGGAGLGSAGVWLSAPVLITGAVSIERRGLAMGFLSSSIGVGLLAVGQAVRVARAAAGDDGIWRPIWVGAAIYSLALAVAVLVLLHPPTTERVPTRLNLDAARQVPCWVQLTAAYLLFGLVISAYAPFLGAALEHQGFARSQIASLYSLIGLAAIFGAMSLGRLSDRAGRRPVMTLALIGIAVSCGLIVAGRQPYATISVLLNGSTSYAFPVLMTAQIRDHLSDRAFSNALGAITFIYGSSLAVGPLLAGLIVESWLGFDGLYIGAGSIALVAAVVIGRLRSPGSTTIAGAGCGAGGPESAALGPEDEAADRLDV